MPHPHSHREMQREKPRSLLSELNESLSHETCRLRHYRLLQSPVYYDLRMTEIADKIMALVKYKDKLDADKRVGPSMIDQIEASILSLRERILLEQQKTMVLAQQASRERKTTTLKASPPTKLTTAETLILLGKAAAWASSVGRGDLLGSIGTPEGVTKVLAEYNISQQVASR